MEKERTLEEWCDMMVKTYNTSILDNFPMSLKLSLQEEAQQCVQSKPNPNYHRSFFGLIKTKKNRNVLMRLINNYFRSKQIETTPTVDFIGGPHTLTLHWSDKYKKIIYIFGELHGKDVCTYDNMMLVQDYLKNIFRHSSAFIDFFLEIEMFTKGKYDHRIFSTPGCRLSDLRRQNIKCIESGQRQQNRECDNRRVHFDDIRDIPVDSKGRLAININSTLALDRALRGFSKYAYEKTIFYDKDEQNESILIKDKKYIIDTLKYIFMISYDIEATIDFIRYGSDEAYKAFYEKEIETHELVNYELSKSTEEHKIREFAEEEFEKMRDDFTLITYKIALYLTKCSEKNIIYDFYKLSDDDYLTFFGYILDFRYQLLLFNSILVDIYTLARMFKKFQLNHTRNTRKTDEPEEPHNIIMYAGDGHSKRVRRFLDKLGFDLISESKGYPVLDFCVDIRHFEQPFFSSWPPKKMPQIQREPRNEKLMPNPQIQREPRNEKLLPNPQIEIEPTSGEMLPSDFQIQTTSMNEIDEATGLDVLKYEAILKYKGTDLDFIYIARIRENMEIANIDITFYPDEIEYYHYVYGYDYKIETYNGAYKGLVRISNSVNSEELIRQFPFLENLKHVDYVMLFLSIQKALESKFITPESNIVIEIRVSYTTLNPSECIRKLVECYEKIGFQKMFPTHYEDIIERIDTDLFEYIPMIGKIENIIDSWAEFENLSVLLELFLSSTNV